MSFLPLISGERFPPFANTYGQAKSNAHFARRLLVLFRILFSQGLGVPRSGAGGPEPMPEALFVPTCGAGAGFNRGHQSGAHEGVLGHQRLWGTSCHGPGGWTVWTGLGARKTPQQRGELGYSCSAPAEGRINASLQEWVGAQGDSGTRGTHSQPRLCHCPPAPESRPRPHQTGWSLPAGGTEFPVLDSPAGHAVGTLTRV